MMVASPSHFSTIFGTLWGMNRKPYPSDVTDEEWSFVAPYLTLIVNPRIMRLFRESDE